MVLFLLYEMHESKDHGKHSSLCLKFCTFPIMFNAAMCIWPDGEVFSREGSVSIIIDSTCIFSIGIATVRM